MSYFMLVRGRSSLCRGVSSYRNKAGWHDVIEIGRPLSGSGYRHKGRDDLKPRVEIKLVSQDSTLHISTVLLRDKTLPWVAVEAAGYDGKPRYWWTFFNVESAGYSAGTDDNSPTGGSIHYILEFRSARFGTGAWPGATPTTVPRTGLDPGRAVDRDTGSAVAALPVPRALKNEWHYSH
jgi:hypothetical protein